jgi:PadR family transcriptional regulator
MKFERELLKGVAPMAVLEVLTREPMYGYQLSTVLAQASGDILALGRGSLYPLLYNLEAKGYVEAKEREADSGRKRRYYTITDQGRKQLADSKKQWKKLREGLDHLFGDAPHEPALSGGGTA